MSTHPRPALHLALTFAALGATGLATAAPAPAAIPHLRLQRVASSAIPAVVSGSSNAYAYQPTSTTVAVRAPATRLRTYTVPAGCVPEAIAAGAIGLTCRAGGNALPVVLTLAGGKLTTVPVANTDTFQFSAISAIGLNWLRVTASANPFSNDPHAINVSGLVERVTGRVVSLGSGDPYPATSFPDLDRANPGRPLCSPVARARNGAFGSVTRYAAVSAIDGWVVQNSSLQQCGRKAIRRFPPGYHPALGKSGVLAYLRPGRQRRIVYQDLGNGRTWTAPFPTASRAPTVAMAAHRLVVSEPAAGFKRYTIYETTRVTR
jgi:hypothetical protein